MMYCFYLTFNVYFTDGTMSVYEVKACGVRTLLYVSDVEEARLAAERTAVNEYGKEVSRVILTNSFMVLDNRK